MRRLAILLLVQCEGRGDVATKALHCSVGRTVVEAPETGMGKITPA